VRSGVNGQAEAEIQTLANAVRQTFYQLHAGMSKGCVAIIKLNCEIKLDCVIKLNRVIKIK